MTTVAVAPVSPRRHEHPVPWKAMARVTWLQRRSTLIGLLVVFVACAVAIVVGQAGTHAAYASFVASGCVQNRFHTPCGNFENWFADNTDLFSAMVIALHVVPVVIGVFVGAPLLSRELESGTFRFTWTQGVGRSRSVVTTLVLLALFVTVATCVLGLVLNWFAHPFEVIGIESQWQSGLFDTTGPMLVAWTLFGLALGTFLGALIGRTVAAMALTAAIVGGFLVASFVWLVARLEAIGALATTRLMPMGLSIGQLNVPGAQFNGPVGSWLVRAWFTGQGGKRLELGGRVQRHRPYVRRTGYRKSRPVTLAVGPPLHLLGELPAGEPLLDLSGHRCGDPGSPGRTSGVRYRSACPSSRLSSKSVCLLERRCAVALEPGGTTSSLEPKEALGIHMTVSERATIVPGSVPPRSTGSDFVAFYEHEFTQAARFAWLLVRTSAVAEDLAQEAFVSLYRGFGQIDNPRGFVHRAIVNQARAWQRNEHRRALKAVRLSREYGPLTPADADLFDLVGTLPYRQRVVIIARTGAAGRRRRSPRSSGAGLGP